MSENKHTVILGTMTFGGQVDETAADRLLNMYLDAGYKDIDTAANYVDGRTEEILGRIITPSLREKLYLATKVGPYTDAGLKPAFIFEQVETSLRRLNTQRVDLLYLHSPDPGTPVEETLEACQKLHEQGKFGELGLSNYTAWQVADIWHICRKNGWQAPTVYQGMYNALTRAVEPELFPALEQFGLRFYAYNPLAGGMLTGKYRGFTNAPDQGRFAVLPFYQDRYWKEAYIQAMDMVARACEDAGVTMPAAALRWIGHHSGLIDSRGHGLILGATTVDQLKTNIEAMAAGPLPDDVIQAFDRAWETVRAHCPKYFRP